MNTISYIVIEMQQNEEGSVATLVTTYMDLNQAQSKYHTILASASISKVPIHTAVILTSNGQLVKSESYRHIQTVEEEPEEE